MVRGDLGDAAEHGPGWRNLTQAAKSSSCAGRSTGICGYAITGSQRRSVARSLDSVHVSAGETPRQHGLAGNGRRRARSARRASRAHLPAPPPGPEAPAEAGTGASWPSEAAAAGRPGETVTT